MKIKNIKKLTNEPWLNLFESSYEHKGHSGKWLFASRKDQLSIALDDRPDAVIVVPVHTDEDGERKLVMTKEYRIPIRSYEIGFPAGLIEDGEDLRETAKRELYEETGLKLIQITRESPTVYNSAGSSDESIVYIFCGCEGTVSNKYTEGIEDITTMLLGKKELEDLFYNIPKDCKFGAKAWVIIFYILASLCEEKNGL